MLNSDLELLSATGFYFLLPFNFAIYYSIAGILRWRRTYQVSKVLPISVNVVGRSASCRRVSH